jgi:hypothetical protein
MTTSQAQQAFIRKSFIQLICKLGGAGTMMRFKYLTGCKFDFERNDHPGYEMWDCNVMYIRQWNAYDTEGQTLPVSIDADYAYSLKYDRATKRNTVRPKPRDRVAINLLDAATPQEAVPSGDGGSYVWHIPGVGIKIMPCDFEVPPDYYLVKDNTRVYSMEKSEAQ